MPLWELSSAGWRCLALWARADDDRKTTLLHGRDGLLLGVWAGHRQARRCGVAGRSFGTVRKPADGGGSKAAGGTVGLLDLTDEASCQRCAEAIAAWCEGGADCVVHNAGDAYPAPMVGADRGGT